jgi:hypothetical protein
MNVPATVCLVLLLVCLITIGANYYYGAHFKSCDACEPNKVQLIDIELPPDSLTGCLYNCIKSNGTRLDPNLNFNNVQGKKINYNLIKEYCPGIVDFYLTNEMIEHVSKHLDKKISFADDSEKYRIFARLYNDESDFINWHYDNNFTRGERYTLVIPIILDDCNTSQFIYKDRFTQQDVTVEIPLGKGVIYNGSEAYHMISKQTQNCKRMVVIIPFYTNYSKSIFGEIRQFFRNLIYRQISVFKPQKISSPL